MTSPRTQEKIVFLGAGNMAEALVKGIQRVGLYPAHALYMTDIEPQRLAHFMDVYHVVGSPHNTDAVHEADVVVLAVKPQTLPRVVKEIKGHLSASVLVVSIVAGIPTRNLELGLGKGVRVVRVMPNMPALVGAGATALCGGQEATSADLDRTEKVFQSVGLVVRVDESLMDAVTALSGSGPAYVFYLVEAMMAAAHEMGLDTVAGRQLTTATVMGAARLLSETNYTPASLRQRVTSKGGTTEAAMSVLQEAGVYEALIKAIRTAQRRAHELSSQVLS